MLLKAALRLLVGGFFFVNLKIKTQIYVYAEICEKKL